MTLIKPWHIIYVNQCPKISYNQHINVKQTKNLKGISYVELKQIFFETTLLFKYFKVSKKKSDSL